MTFRLIIENKDGKLRDYSDVKRNRSPIKSYNMHFRTHRSKDKQHYFTLNAKNGKVIMTSETYKSRRNMMNTLNFVNVNDWEVKYDITK
jgi:uncharacterized protein YegP (UPF0339 family)